MFLLELIKNVLETLVSGKLCDSFQLWFVIKCLLNSENSGKLMGCRGHFFCGNAFGIKSFYEELN